MAKKANSVGARRVVEVLLGEDQAVRWSRPVLRFWGFLFVGFVLLFVWLPIRVRLAGSRVLLWVVTYTAYLLILEILARKAKRWYESTPFQLFRLHFNLVMITTLMLVGPPIASGYLWFFFSLPILAVLLYFGHLIPLLVTYLEVCAAILVVIFAQGTLTPLAFAAMVAQDAILGLLAAVLYFFVHFFPRLREESTLLQAATTLIRVLDQKALAQLLADAAEVGVPASDAAVVHLLGGEGNRILVPVGSSRLDLTTLGRSPMKIGVGIAGHAIQNRDTINVSYVDEDDRYLRLPPSFTPFKSLLVAPMYVGDKNVGTISVHSVKKGAFDVGDERFLTMLAAQGATAIANAELYDTHTRRRQQISDILEASSTFGLNQPFDTLLGKIAVAVCRCSGYRMAVVNLLDEASGEIVVGAMAGVPRPGMRELEGMRIPLDAVVSLLQDQFLISRSYFIRHDRRPEIPDIDQYTFTPDFGERKPGQWHQEDMLIVPIQTREQELLGYISVDGPSDRGLPSLDTVQALELLATMAATAIQNTRLYEEQQRRSTQLALINDIGGKIGAVLDLDSVLDEAARLVHESFGYHHVGLFTLDREQNEFVMKARAGDFTDLFPPDHRMKLGQGMVGWVGCHGETLLANDVRVEPRYVNFFPDLVPTQSELSVPIRVGEEVVGVFDVQSSYPNAFDENSVMVLETLADQVAVAIGNAHLFANTQRRIRDLEIVNNIAQIISTKLDTQGLFQAIVSQIADQLKCTHCTLFLSKEEDGELLLVPQVTHGVRRVQMTRRFKPGEGLAGWVFQHGESLVMADAREDRRFAPARERQGRPRSMLVAPVIVGDHTIGVISADQDEFEWFSESDRRLLDALARQAGIAIERATALKLLQGIGNEIIRAQKVDDILQQIVSGAIELTNTTSGVIHLISEDGKSVIKSFEHPPDFEHPGPRMGAEGGLTRQVIATGEVVRIQNIRDDDPRVSPALHGHVRSMIAVPLKFEQEVIGVLYLNDEHPHDFSETEVSLLSTLASQAAIAIENARLFEQLKQEITERRQAQEALVREQYLMRLLMDNAPDAIYFKDTDSRFIRINKAHAGERWFRLSGPEEAVGKTDFDFFTREHAEQAYEDEQRVIRTGQPLVGIEEKETWRDRRETWASTTKVPLHDKGGNIVGTFGISRDITERKQAEEALRHRNCQLELLNRVGQAFSSTLDLDHVLATVLEEASHLLGIVASSVWLIDPETDDLVCVQAIGPRSEVMHDQRLAPRQGIAGWVVCSGKSLIVPDTRTDKRHFKGVDRQTGLEMRSILSVPLRVKRGVIGVLQMVSTEVDRFKSMDLTLVEPLAASAAVAIENARLYKETDRLRAFNEDIVRSMEEGILLEDATGHITFVNPRAAELLGYTPEELIGCHYTAVVAPEAMAKVEQETAKRPHGIGSRYETALLTKESQRVSAIVSATPVFDEGSFAGVLVVYTDITDRKRQETRLRNYLSTVTSSLAQHTRLEGLYEFIVETGARFLSACDCALFLVGRENGGELQLVATAALPSSGGESSVIGLPIGSGPGCGLIAHVGETCQPIRLLGKEISQHPSWNMELWTRLGWGFDPEADHSLLAAPMCLPDGRLVGVLVARDAESREGFSEFDEVLIQTLATNAAADIERVRSLARVRKEAVRAERKRLETELHEAMNVLATGVRWEAEILLEEIERNDLVAARVALERLQAALPRAYTDLRYLLEDLRDPTLEQEGLLTALRKRAGLIGRGHVVVRGDLRERLPPEVEGILYRVGQEVMSNAVKHSGVVHDPDVKIEVWLEQSDGQVKLCVTDDGVGFDVESTLALSHKWGLRRLRDTLREIGGRLGIESVPGKGATICATVDLTRGNRG